MSGFELVEILITDVMQKSLGDHADLGEYYNLIPIWEIHQMKPDTANNNTYVIRSHLISMAKLGLPSILQAINE